MAERNEISREYDIGPGDASQPEVKNMFRKKKKDEFEPALSGRPQQCGICKLLSEHE